MTELMNSAFGTLRLKKMYTGALLVLLSCVLLFCEVTAVQANPVVLGQTYAHGAMAYDYVGQSFTAPVDGLAHAISVAPNGETNGVALSIFPGDAGCLGDNPIYSQGDISLQFQNGQPSLPNNMAPDYMQHIELLSPVSMQEGFEYTVCFFALGLEETVRLTYSSESLSEFIHLYYGSYGGSQFSSDQWSLVLQVEITPTLLVHYEFEGDFQDSSGNELNGEGFGDYHFGNEGPVGMALDFSAGDAYVRVPPVLFPEIDTFSISAWLKLDSLKEEESYVFTHFDGGELQVHFDPDPGQMRFGVKLASEVWHWVYADSPPLDTFAHFTWIYRRGESIEIWINGALQASEGVPEGSLNNPGTGWYNAIGAYLGNNAEPQDIFANQLFSGSMDDFRVYGIALDASTIRLIARQHPWSAPEVVDEMPAGFVRMVSDSEGFLHALYNGNDDTNILFHATNRSGSWQRTLIGENFTNSYTGLELLYTPDSDTLYLAYIADSTGGERKIVYGISEDLGQSWGLEDAIDELWFPSDLALEVDDSGGIHIAFSTDDTAYYSSSTTSWTLEEVDDRPYAGRNGRLIRDSDGVIHYVYGVDTSLGCGYGYCLAYAARDGGSWTIEDVPSDQNLHRYSSRFTLLLDESNRLNIFYENSIENALMHLWHVGGPEQWESEVITRNPDAQGPVYAVREPGSDTFHILHQLRDSVWGYRSIASATNRLGFWQSHEIIPSRGYLDDFSLAFNQVAGIPEMLFVNRADEGDWQGLLSHSFLVNTLHPALSTMRWGGVEPDTTQNSVLSLQNFSSAPVTINTLSISGPDSSSFAVATSDCVSQTIAPYEQCLVTLEYTQTGAGQREGFLQVASDDPVAPLLSVALIGNSETLIVEPAAIDFGYVKPGEWSIAELNITNLTAEPLEVWGEFLGGQHFYIYTEQCGAMLSPGETCTIFVEFFSPPSLGQYSDTAQIGIGTYSREVEISAFNATLLPPGLSALHFYEPGEQTTLTLTNPLDDPVTIQDLGFQDGTWYEILSHNCLTTLNIDQSCSITIRFTGENLLGYYADTLFFETNNAVLGTISVPLNISMAPRFTGVQEDELEFYAIAMSPDGNTLVAIVDGHAFGSDADHIIFYNVSNDGTLNQFGSTTSDHFGVYSRANDVVINNSHVYISSTNNNQGFHEYGVHVFDLENLSVDWYGMIDSSPSSWYGSTVDSNGGITARLAIAGGKLALTGGHHQNWVQLLDVADPLNISTTGQLSLTENSPTQVSLTEDGNTLIVSSNSHVEIFDISNPATPQLLSILDDLAGADGIAPLAVGNGKLFLAKERYTGGDGRLTDVLSYSISNPAAPVLVAEHTNVPSVYGSLAASSNGNWLFFSIRNNFQNSIDLHVFDITGNNLLHLGMESPSFSSFFPTKPALSATGEHLFIGTDSGVYTYHFPRLNALLPQVITFETLPESIAYGTGPYELVATASSGLPVAFESSNEAVAVIDGSMLVIAGAGEAMITVSQAGSGMYEPATSVSQTLVVEPAVATISLSGLTHTWDGDPKVVTVATDPAGLTYTVTYDESTEAPSAVGSYEVVATITEANYHGSATATLLIEETPVTLLPIDNFSDPQLRTIIQNIFGTDQITMSDILATSSLDLSGLSIASLSGLEHFANLESLNLRGMTGLEDISAIAGLHQLQWLSLGGSGISDLSALQNLGGLRTLALWQSGIEDISMLSELTNLEHLYLGQNAIADPAVLAGLTSLRSLYLDGNAISSLDFLQNLTSLEVLYLGNNAITDISVLQNLLNLRTLQLDRNQISNLAALQYLVHLEELYLSRNQVSDITPLAGLGTLRILGLWGNNVTSLTPLQNLTSLRSLNLGSNGINAIGSLGSLASLETLFLDSNQVSDISVLSSMGSLEWVNLYNNPLSETSQQLIETLRQNSITVAMEDYEHQWGTELPSQFTTPPTGSLAGSRESTSEAASGCFIATAAYGSAFHRDILVLRQFRDQILMQTSMGKAFVEQYYTLSPPIARVIEQHPWLALTVRALLLPLVALAWLLMHPWLLALLLPSGIACWYTSRLCLGRRAAA